MRALRERGSRNYRYREGEDGPDLEPVDEEPAASGEFDEIDALLARLEGRAVS